MTDRISVHTTSPSTTFVVEGDVQAQDPGRNVSWVRAWIRCNNGPGGSTGSYYGGSGRQEIHAQSNSFGRTFLGQHTGNPFLPSGYPDGAQRWRDGPYDFEVTHDANGNGSLEFSQRLVFSVDRTDYSGWFALPRIAKAPGAPGTPTFSEILPTSVRVSWSAAPRGNADIDGYGLRLATDPSMDAGIVFDAPIGNVLSYVVPGLTPGTTYYARVSAHNGDGWGTASAVSSVRTLSGAYVSNGSAWLPTEVFVDDGTTARVGEVYVSDGSAWKPAG